MLPLSLNPIAFTLGPLTVHWYGIILGLGALAGLFLAIQEGKRFGIMPDFFLDLLLYGVPSAIICARIYYVAFKWDYYSAHPGEIVQIWNGGIAIYGALIGAFLCGFIYSRAKGYRFIRIVDICAPSLLIGQMIGRWGNFMNQEAYGGPTNENFLRNTLHLPNFIVDQMYIGGIYRHPTFLYESLWSLVGLAIIFIIRRMRFLRVGELCAFYLIWYSFGRFLVEALRTDSLAFQGPDWLASLLRGIWSPMTAVFEEGYLDPAYGNVRTSQLLALILVVAGIVFIVVRRVTGAAKERYLDPVERKGTVPAEAAVPAESAVVAENAEEPVSVQDAAPIDNEDKAEASPDVPAEPEQNGDTRKDD
ncbi:prolipoprotein diacylglyceryl transferase [Cohnella candidum]|uniref:Phosphatidylglycerol--prolipoprotein diacylglyceryl transferase n=1 Tax=Cohnella candidum TaxID=2674991 RepID=A0A3G3K2X3_9BACL|nr:prolipoprotein diacylglyceryl transferase [Cohnella candidum]AYQ74720.1 prolipoprotein diacylglyceryl transferase [Cohnella candidum]